MNTLYIKSVVYRFLRGFAAGGIAAMAELLRAGVTITSWNDMAHLGFILLGAFVTGGLLALDKAVRGEPMAGTLDTTGIGK